MILKKNNNILKYFKSYKHKKYIQNKKNIKRDYKDLLG